MTQGQERARTRECERQRLSLYRMCSLCIECVLTMSSRARARVSDRARARAREHAALFGSREERAGEAGLPLLALLTLISLFSSKMWDGRQSSVLLCRGARPRRARTARVAVTAAQPEHSVVD